MASASDMDALRVLVLAPTGRDAELTCALLEQRSGMGAVAVRDVYELCQMIHEGAGAAILAEESLTLENARCLTDVMATQPAWSDLSVIVLTGRASATAGGTDALEMLRARGSITLLDRPIKVMTLISTVQTALRARQRQYQVRDLLTQMRDDVRHRDEFLAMLGHELRNPLGAIRNAMSVLDASSPPADSFEQEQRQIVLRQANHLSRLVDDLLDVSRITSGKISLQRQVVDLRALASSAVEAVQPAARAQRHEIEFTTPQQPVTVEVDPVRIEQAITNLLTNAIKYTPSGGHVSLTLRSANQKAQLRVRDDGLGMSPDLLPRVFDLFTQAERSLDRSQGGLGIGLTLVRRLVEMHEGSVSAYSQGIGRGSEFTIELPLTDAPVAAPPPPRPMPSTNGKPHHILLIEDHADARRALQRLLQLWGHTVDIADDGRRGVDLAASLKPEIALVDIGLPGLDGYAVAREIRSLLGNSIRLIALTGYGQPDDHARTKAAGFDVHLVKPVDAQKLNQLLKDACAARNTLPD